MLEVTNPSAAEYLRCIMQHVNECERTIDLLADQADIAAARVVDGGKLYGLSDDGGGFVSELSGRSGGLTGIAEAPDISDIRANDFVVAATVDQSIDELRERISTCREKGAHVMLIGSEASAIRDAADGFVTTGLSAGTAPLFQFKDEDICPTAGVMNIALMWLFTAEFTAACTRRGKMPAFYQSVGVSYGSFRNQLFGQRMFYDDSEITVAPIPPRELGRQYLANLQRCLAGLLVGEIGKFARIGEIAGETLRSGNAVWCDVIGHHLNYQPGSVGDPGLIRFGRPERQEPADGVRKDDFYIFNGYYTYPQDQFPKYRDIGVRSAWLLGGRETQGIYPLPGEIHIDAQWRFGDASLYVPGHDIKILPVSGVVMTTTLWMIVAETAKNGGDSGAPT